MGRKSLHVVGALALIAGLHCGGRETTGTNDVGQHPAERDGGLTSIDGSTQVADAPPDDWTTCKSSTDCLLAPVGRCCAACKPMTITEYAAINAKHQSDFAASQGCSGAACAPCPAPTPDPHIDFNFLALCQSGRCTAVDLRFSKYAACTNNGDCALQWGLGCCEGCDDSELIVVNPATGLSTELCPIAAPCEPPGPECLARRNPLRMAECAGTLCQLSD